VPILGNFISGLAQVLDMALSLYMWLIIIRALSSWLSPDPYNPIFQFLIRVTEPVLSFIRRYLPARVGMMDLSPIIAIFAIVFIKAAVVQNIYVIARSLR
jgi:YggT family protein